MTSRTSDPSTSKDAGVQATTPVKLRASHALILRVFAAYGPMNDKDLLDRVNAVERNIGIRKVMSPSGVRSRRSELSRPNMDRLNELRAEEAKYHPERPETVRESNARFALKSQGYRSKLIDTGQREEVDGRRVIVWGLAE